MTNAEARFSKCLHPWKPEVHLDGQPRTSTSTLTQLLNYETGSQANGVYVRVHLLHLSFVWASMGTSFFSFFIGIFKHTARSI